MESGLPSLVGADCNTHFTQWSADARAQSPQPGYERQYEHRRQNTRDTKVLKQIRDDAQFVGTNIEHVWYMIKDFAPAHHDWKMTAEGFGEFCRKTTVTSEYLVTKLLKIFDKDQTYSINGVWLARTFHAVINGQCADEYVTEAFDQYARGVDDEGINIDYINALHLSDPNAETKGKKASKKKKKASDEVERDGNVTYQMQEAMKSCVKRYPPKDGVRMVYYTDFKRWWETEPVLVAAHVQQILEVTASLYYQEQSALAGPSTGRDLPKLGKEFMQSLEQPSDDCTDYVAFDTVKVGMQVRMTPTGFSKEHRYLGTVIGPSLEEGGPQMNGHVVMHWRTPEEGGPPQSADAKSLSQSSKYDDILGKIEDMMRNQWRVQEDIEAIMPRERIEMKEWWEGGGRPERILPFDEIKPFPPAREGEDATTLPFLPDGRIVTMSPEGVPDALLDEHRYPATIIGRLADKVVLYWHPLPEAEAEQAELNVQKGAVRRPEGECQVPQSWWEGRGRPARTTGWYSDHDSWLLRKLEANGGVMPLDAKKGKKGKKGKKK